jgi:hypothetical protein
MLSYTCHMTGILWHDIMMSYDRYMTVTAYTLSKLSSSGDDSSSWFQTRMRLTQMMAFSPRQTLSRSSLCRALLLKTLFCRAGPAGPARSESRPTVAVGRMASVRVTVLAPRSGTMMERPWAKALRGESQSSASRPKYGPASGSAERNGWAWYCKKNHSMLCRKATKRRQSMKRYIDITVLRLLM